MLQIRCKNNNVTNQGDKSMIHRLLSDITRKAIGRRISGNTVPLILCILFIYLLAGCTGDKAQMLHQLEALEQKNHCGEQMLNDSLAELLVIYFDRYGNANERMRSRYILGRTYYCLGEIPRALETYTEAIDCADTTSADCDYKVLSRIHAQSAVIYDSQLLPLNRLKESRLAEFYAWKGKDTLQAIECYAQQADAYELLNKPDSLILIREKASDMYSEISRTDRSALVLISTIPPLLKKNEVEKARKYLFLYEANSHVFDENGNIEHGREVFYYIKGEYYLAVNSLDSAEYMFRKELQTGKDMNNQIAGCKGLQKVFEKRRLSDSIAKYATLSYELNDSAYSLAEMQNMQKFQASYNYNHLKYQAEKKKLEAKVAWLVVILIIILVFILGVHFGLRYRKFKKVDLDYRLRSANITRHLKNCANSNPPRYPTLDDWDKFRSFMEREVPSIRKVLKVEELSITESDYDVCLMIRAQLLPIEISKLKQCSPSHISNIRKRLLLRIFGKEGGSEDFDDEIVKIVN